MKTLPSSEAAWRAQCLLTTAQMGAADAAAISAGTPGIDLMERAGRCVAEEIRLRWRPRPVLVLCGPGNNGGDGFVIARYLAESGWPVAVWAQAPKSHYKGDARIAYDRMSDMPDPPGAVADPAAALDASGLVVDALFGAGLSRPLTGRLAEIVAGVNERRASGDCAVVAVDMPSGVDGDTGAIAGDAIVADLTVTFFRAKPGHFLLPGRQQGGVLVVKDIGIAPEVLDAIAPNVAANHPGLWSGALRPPSPTDHKYTRGHALVLAGAMPGASVLAARAAARIGAGMVTVGWLDEDHDVCAGMMAARLPASILQRRFESIESLVDYGRDRKVQAVLAGQGYGRSSVKSRNIIKLTKSFANCILDADGINALSAGESGDIRQIGIHTILTPHAGEFSRIAAKGNLDSGTGKLAVTQALARDLGCTVVHKGFDTVIAAPGGQTVINGNGSPNLASAGTGDVLAGGILGLRAQGMPAMEAACAAVWLNADAAQFLGRGMMADDLPDALPVSLNRALTEFIHD